MNSTKKQQFLKVRSRHPSHNILRKKIPTEKKAVFRLGSSTEMPEDYIEINTIDAVKNSANKLLMKTCFDEAGVNTAEWWEITDDLDINDLPYPVVLKHVHGSRGTGNTLINSVEGLKDHLQHITNHNKYIIERFHNYNREYRLHVTKDGCFYTCRKMLKSDAQERWYRNNDNCVWLLEENEQFDKPVNWDDIVEHCVRALEAVGLDVGACDVRVQSARNKDGDLRENPKFIILEINSAASFGDTDEKETIVYQKYLEILPKLIEQKSNVEQNI